MITQLMFTGVVGYIIFQRVRATRFGKKNCAEVLAQGGRLHTNNYVGLIKAFQSSWMLSMLAEVWLLQATFNPVLAACAAVAVVISQTLRYQSMHALGDRWIHQVVTVPNQPVINTGIYRYIRHPNWTALMIEVAAVPLLHGAYFTAAIFSVFNTLLMIKRVSLEEAALIADTNYGEVFQDRPRFIPLPSFRAQGNEAKPQPR